ncbi:hypothetical protein DK37_09865 [Halomonas sp. SUBG004]|nr:hypothetical protein DK37_09865 [Halomonas sp. SUBG004]
MNLSVAQIAHFAPLSDDDETRVIHQRCTDLLPAQAEQADAIQAGRAGAVAFYERYDEVGKRITNMCGTGHKALLTQMQSNRSREL